MKDDAISRQAVLKLLSTIPPEEAMTKAMLIQSVKQMDAAQPSSSCVHENDTISRQAAIDAIMGEYPDAHYPDWYASKIRALPSAQPEWIPVMDGDGVLPEVDEDGYSDFVLVSFSNVSGLDIGQYREDENGGAFYSGDDDDPYTKIGVFVNAWMPLPKPWEGEEAE